MNQLTYSVTIQLAHQVSGQSIIDGVEQIVTTHNGRVHHKVTCQKLGPEGEGPFILGQSSEYPWEDFVLSPSQVRIDSFDPDGNYSRIVVSHARHYWDNAKKDDDHTDRMLRALRSFADALSSELPAPVFATV